jgi:ABC-type dipeptide/oligopeptide/nickel transport system permease component
LPGRVSAFFCIFFAFPAFFIGLIAKAKRINKYDLKIAPFPSRTDFSNRINAEFFRAIQFPALTISLDPLAQQLCRLQTAFACAAAPMR